MPPQEQGISWHVDTHVHQERTNDWYWTLGLMIVAGAAISIFLGNLLFAVILVLGGGCMGFIVARGPREHSVRIDQRGVSLDGTLYTYEHIHSFWVDEHGEQLLIATTGMLHPQLVVPLLSSERAKVVRQYLRRMTQEEEQHPHLGVRVAELFGL